jgi:predicted RNase H-like HicB family nuclease
MERFINIHVEKLPEGVYLATSDDVPGLVAQGRTVTETMEIARDVARKLLEAQAERRTSPSLQIVGDAFGKRLIKHPSPDHRCRDRRVLADWGAVLGNHLHLLHTGFFQRDSEDICKAPGRWPWRFRSG